MPALSAWPFVVVILLQTAVAGFSVYTLSACRAYVTGESLWSKGQHEAIYFLDLYLDTGQRSDFQSFERAIKVTLAYRVGRQFLESRPPDLAAARAAFVEAGNPPQDIARLMWTFRHFRGVPYLQDAIARWKEADQYILELDRLGTSIGAPGGRDDAAASRKRLEEIDVAITPRTIAFSRALNDGARMVEWLLMVVNLGLAGVLGLLTVWRVGRVLKQRRQIEEKLVWQASHDELTGLPNRRAFEDALARAMTPTERGGGGSCALMFIDLDQFKIVNDTCGHAAGDALLRRICAPLQAALGERDLLARLGGDEFSILMPGATRDHAFAVAESLRAAVEQIDFVWDGRIFGVTASIGLVHDAGTALTAEQMMRAADMACFMAKERGRNRVQGHLEEDAALLGRMREMNWVQRIHQALNDDRFCLYAQEIVALADATDDDMHLEVLIRMRDERGTLIPPSSFLPAAERFGLVRLIDRWVVRSAFRILSQRNAMPDLPAIGRCAINLSGATIGDETFLDLLKDAFAEFGVPPEIICFEVTETSAIVNLDDARAFIQDLRGLGCTFALDDFGSGMSSLNYLKALPVDFLKIDGGFVRNILDDRADRAMVEMISHVGHVMGKRIIAEFVESQAIADALREIGVDYGQGHGIAPPKPFDARFMGVATASYHHERYPRLTA